MEPKEPTLKAPENLTGQQYLERENTQREQGLTLEAIDSAQSAFRIFVGAGDLVGAARSCAAEAISWGHLADKEEKPTFRDRAKSTALLGGEIARKSGKPEALAIPLFRIGSVLHQVGAFDEAIKAYRKALQALPQSPDNRPSVNADLRVHLETANYQAGDKTALERARQALADLEAADENKFEKDVWVSGGCMKIAKAVHPDNPQLAKEFLAKAKQISNANPELVVRTDQIATLEKELV